MKRVAGFTLLELMIVLVIAAVLVTVGVPAFRNFITGQELKSVAQSLYADLLFARSEAIKRNADVDFASNDGVWGDGWLVTATGATEVDCSSSAPDTDVLRAGCGLARSAVFIKSAPAGNVTFSGNGRADATATFVLCDAEKQQGRRVRIGVDGLPQVTRLSTCP